MPDFTARNAWCGLSRGQLNTLSFDLYSGFSPVWVSVQPSRTVVVVVSSDCAAGFDGVTAASTARDFHPVPGVMWK